MKPAFLLFLLILSGGALAETEPIKRNDKGERVWDFDYLRGTSAEIRVTLNKETTRFKAQVTEAERVLADDKQELERHRAAALAKLKENKDYQKALADTATYKDRLDKARAEKNRDESMRLSTQYNNARETVTRMEKDLASAGEFSRQLQADMARLADSERRLATYKKGLADAQAWRDRVVASLRNTYQFHDPVAAGHVGILGDITPRELRAGGELLCSARIRRSVPIEGSNTEGMIRVSVTYIPTSVIVKRSGLEAGKVQIGKPMRFDRSVKITSAQPNGERVDLTVEVQEDDLDGLMRALADE